MIRTQRWQSTCRPWSMVGVMTLLLGAWLWGSATARAISPALERQIVARENALGPKDAIGHQRLARFLYHNGIYHRALEQVDTALKINPKFQDAQLLKRLIERKIAHLKPSPTATTTRPGKQKLHTLLTMNDIYKVRLWELSRHEPHPLEGSIVGGSKTLLRFWRRVILPDPDYQTPPLTRRDREGFISPNNFVQQVRLMLRLGNAHYWDKIHIKNDPQVMQTFRQSVEPVVLQSCATVGCHRSQGAPGFRLFGARGTPTLRQTYSNFYILNKLSYHGQKMVNRGNPPLSLIYQYLLPRDDAAYRHPGKKGPRYHVLKRQQIVDWIESLRFPAHRYGITNFQMPVPKKKNKPSVKK